jgi:hypothetical protein
MESVPRFLLQRVSMIGGAFSRLFSRTRASGKSLDLDQLTRLVRRYSVEQQQVPKDLAELVALKYLDTLPNPPDGQRYVIDRKTAEVRLE